MLLRWDPFRELDRLTEQAWSATAPRPPRAMPMDAYRHGDRFVIRFDLPGVDPESIDLTVERNVLTVRAERRWEPEEGDEVVAAERPRGTFTRQVLLGDTLDTDHLEARYEHGVLVLEVPVAEAAKPRKVEIRGADGGAAAIDATSHAA